LTQPPSRDRWYVLGLMTLVYAISIADRFSISTLIEPIRIELQLSDSGVAFLTGVALALFYVTVGIPIALLADKANRRNILAISLALWSAMTAVCGLAQNYTQLAVARMSVGIGEAGKFQSDPEQEGLNQRDTNHTLGYRANGCTGQGHKILAALWQKLRHDTFTCFDQPWPRGKQKAGQYHGCEKLQHADSDTAHHGKRGACQRFQVGCHLGDGCFEIGGCLAPQIEEPITDQGPSLDRSGRRGDRKTLGPELFRHHSQSVDETQPEPSRRNNHDRGRDQRDEGGRKFRPSKIF